MKCAINEEGPVCYKALCVLNLLEMSESNLLKLSINDFTCIRIEFLFYLAFKDEASLFKSNNKASKLVSFSRGGTELNVVVDTAIKREFNLFKHSESNRI